MFSMSYPTDTQASNNIPMKHAVTLAFILLPLLVMGQHTKPSANYHKNRIAQLRELSLLYDQIDYIDDCNFVIVTDSENQQGIVDPSGKVLLPCQYRIFRQSGTTLFLVANDHKMGLLNKRMKWVLPMEYDHNIDCFECLDMGNFFSKGYACLSKGGKHGLVDTTGKVLIPFKFDQGFEVDMSNKILHFSVYEENMSQAWITDFNGNLLVGPYEAIGRFHEGIASFWKDGKMGFLDLKGKVIIPNRYQCCGLGFANGCALVQQDNDMMLIDRNGKTKHVFNATWEIESCLWDNTIFIVSNQGDEYGGSYGAVDMNGRQVAPVSHDRWYTINDNYLAMIDNEADCNIYNLNGEQVARFSHLKCTDYDEGDSYHSPYFAVIQDSLWGFVDSNFHIVVPLQYKEASYLGYGYGRVVNSDKQVSVIDMSGKTVISGPYEYITPISNDLFRFYVSNPKNGNDIISGYVDLYGNTTASRKQQEKIEAWSQQRR